MGRQLFTVGRATVVQEFANIGTWLATSALGGQKQLTYWLLSGQTLPASIAPEHRHDDVDELFAAVKVKYPNDALEEE